MTREARTRPDVAYGEPLGRHVKTSRRGRRALLKRSAPRTTRPPASVRRHRVALNAVTVMSVSAGIVGTLALPSYAMNPDELHAGGLRGGGGHAVEVQRFVASPAARPADALRHEFSATTMEELETERERKRAEEREFAEAKRRALEAAAAGKPVEQTAPTAPDVTAPAGVPDAAPAADSGSIVSVARQYLGVPYVFGGASPAGFDCSGLVMHVYAQFGIQLPHSSLRQAVGGTPVSDPVPGDLVVVDGGAHIGIYSGDGFMIDSPMPGRVVNERPIYTTNHYFVRY